MKQVELFSGTLEYQAPEVTKGNEPTMASDMWSFGVLLFQLYVGNDTIFAFYWLLIPREKYIYDILVAVENFIFVINIIILFVVGFKTRSVKLLVYTYCKVLSNAVFKSKIQVLESFIKYVQNFKDF